MLKLAINVHELNPKLRETAEIHAKAPEMDAKRLGVPNDVRNPAHCTSRDAGPT